MFTFQNRKIWFKIASVHTTFWVFTSQKGNVNKKIELTSDIWWVSSVGSTTKTKYSNFIYEIKVWKKVTENLCYNILLLMKY